MYYEQLTYIGLAVIVLYLYSGLMGVTKGDEPDTKTAICEITNTSGVYPIYGTITLTQEVWFTSIFLFNQRL